jgi:superfamily I DNA/RNA helicase
LQLTEQQVGINKAVRTDSRIKINAFAGTGKTTTLGLVAEGNPNLDFLYLAFNKAIAEEAKRKFPSNVDVKTTHGLAFRHTRNALGLSNVRGDYKPRELMDILGVGDWSIVSYVNEVFAAFCYSAEAEITEGVVRRLIDEDEKLTRSGLALTRLYPNLTVKGMTEMVRNLYGKFLDKSIAATHNFYLKFFQVNIKKYVMFMRYTACLLDEAQDSNAATLAIFEALPGIKIICGDRHQAIYGFRRSMNAMAKFSADSDHYLSTSFRIPTSVARKASKLLFTFKGEKEAIVAVRDESEGTATTCHISRTNAQLIEIMAEMRGEKFKTVRDPSEIFRLPTSLYLFKAAEETGNRELKKGIKETWLNFFRTYQQIEEYAEEISDVELKSSLKVVEKFGPDLITLENIAKGNSYLNDVDTFLTTAHTSKGLEWDRVKVCSDFPDLLEIISDAGFETIQQFRSAVKKGGSATVQSIAEEVNLFYVAITRTKKKLDILSDNGRYLEMEDDEINAVLRVVSKKKDKQKSRSAA